MEFEDFGSKNVFKYDISILTYHNRVDNDLKAWGQWQKSNCASSLGTYIWGNNFCSPPDLGIVDQGASNKTKNNIEILKGLWLLNSLEQLWIAPNVLEP